MYTKEKGYTKEQWFYMFNRAAQYYPIEPNKIYRKYGIIGAKYFSQWWQERRSGKFKVEVVDNRKLFW